MLEALGTCEHHVVAGRDSDIVVLAELHARTVRIESSLQRNPHPIWDLIAVFHLRRLVRAEHYDAVVTHQSKAGVLGRLAARSAGSACVVHSLSMANFGPGYPPVQSRVYRCIERWLARYTTAYVVVGCDLAQRFIDLGLPAHKLAIIRSAARLPSPEVSRAHARAFGAAHYKLPGDRPWILYLGSLEERKNVLSLPIVMQQVVVLTEGSRPYLVIAGEGPLDAQLKELLQRMDLVDDVGLLGYVSDPTPLLVGADVVVLLSRAEGMPQVLVQAAAARTPFVSFDVDGVDELLMMGAVGTIVDQDDLVEASRALRFYLDGHPHEQTADVDLSSWQRPNVLRQYSDLFAQLLAPTGVFV